MPLAMQAKLLRALQERKVRPIGSEQETPFDVRLVAATNRDLESDVEEGRFRADLFFRIDVVRLPLPPLRARGGDILLLAQHFLERHASAAGKTVRGISATAAERLLAYSWPGNVRELENSMARAVAVTAFEEIVVEDLPERIRTYKASHVIVASDDPTELVPMEQVERRYIERVLDAVGGNKTQAAKVLGFDRKTLYNKLERHGLAKKST
jgi:two-component system response regulator HydG